jgi:hypothetical protein
VIETTSETSAQVPPGMVHRNSFTPVDKPETVEVASELFAKLPEPDTTDQLPPVAGVAASVVEEVQMAWFGPASGESGFSSTVTETSSNEATHVPFEIVQRSTVVPVGRPETEVVANVASAKEAVPEVTVQSPVPVSGTFPERMDVVAQIV